MGSTSVCSCSCEKNEQLQEISLVVSLLIFKFQSQPVQHDFTTKARASNPTINKGRILKLSTKDSYKLANLQKFIKRYLKSQKVPSSRQLARANLEKNDKTDEGKVTSAISGIQIKRRNSNNQLFSAGISKICLIEKHKKHSLMIIRSSLRESSISKRIISYSGSINDGMINLREANCKNQADKVDFSCDNTSTMNSEAEYKAWEDGSYYIGFIKEKMANGFGIFVHSSGDVFKGEFFNDKSCGFGSYINKQKCSECFGEWIDDLQNGFGVEIWKDKSYYIGEFKNGKQHGYGTYKWSNGSEYEGEWSEGSFSGFGVYTFNMSRKYMGEFKNNKMHGYGELYWDTHLYIGFHKEEKKDGFGIYFSFNPKRVYIGMWKQGQQHGLGKVMTDKSSRFAKWTEGKKTEPLRDSDCLLYINKNLAKLMSLSLIELENHLFI